MRFGEGAPQRVALLLLAPETGGAAETGQDGLLSLEPWPEHGFPADRIDATLQSDGRPLDGAARHAGRRGDREYAAIADRPGRMFGDQPKPVLLRRQDEPPNPCPDVIRFDPPGG